MVYMGVEMFTLDKTLSLNEFKKIVDDPDKICYYINFCGSMFWAQSEENVLQMINFDSIFNSALKFDSRHDSIYDIIDIENDVFYYIPYIGKDNNMNDIKIIKEYHGYSLTFWKNQVGSFTFWFDTQKERDTIFRLSKLKLLNYKNNKQLFNNFN